jgi:hypothetical protein
MPPAPTPASYDSRLSDALTKRRYGNAIKPLTAVISLQDLLDADFCRNVSQELAKDGRAWEVRRATPDLWQHIPDAAGLYMFVLAPHLRLKMAHSEIETGLPRALYVGRAGTVSGSGTLKARYRTEYKNYVACDPDRLWDETQTLDRRGVLKKYLNLWPLQYWYLEIAERETIGRLETGLIKLLNPPLNSQGTAKLRPIGSAVPAF